MKHFASLVLSALLLVAFAGNSMAQTTIQPGSNFTAPGVSLQANTARTFGPVSFAAGTTDIDLNVNLANADALNPATDILIVVEWSFDGGTTWVETTRAEYIGGPQNQRHPGGPIAMPGVSFGTGGKAMQVRLTATSAANISTLSEVISVR